jgi:hypothetical protein
MLLAAIAFCLTPFASAQNFWNQALQQSAHYYDNVRVLPGPGYQPQTLNGTPQSTWQPIIPYRYSLPRYEMPRQRYHAPVYYTPQQYYAPQTYVPQFRMPQLQVPQIPAPAPLQMPRIGW